MKKLCEINLCKRRLKFFKCLVIIETWHHVHELIVIVEREKEKFNLKANRSTPHTAVKPSAHAFPVLSELLGKVGDCRITQLQWFLSSVPLFFLFHHRFLLRASGVYALLLLSPHLYIFLPSFPTFLCSWLFFFFCQSRW